MTFIPQARIGALTPRLFNFIQRRFNRRESIHRYVEPHRFKKHMLAAAEPYVKRRYQLPSETCVGTNKKEHELSPLDKIYVNEIIDDINKQDFLLIFQHNYTPFQSERVYKNTLIKSGGIIHDRSNGVYREVFKALNIDTLQHLLVARNTLVIGPIDKLPTCVGALKKMPQFILLAGTINGEVYEHRDLQAIARSPDINLSRAELLSILSTPSIDLSYYLQQYSESIKDTQT